MNQINAEQDRITALAETELLKLLGNSLGSAFKATRGAFNTPHCDIKENDMLMVPSISDEEIRKMAKAEKQRDIEQAKQMRQHFSNLKFPGAHAGIQITGLEELESKPLEEYEKDIRERFSQLFPPKSST